MTANTINYQQIYEEELSESLKTSLEKGRWAPNFTILLIYFKTT